MFASNTVSVVNKDKYNIETREPQRFCPGKIRTLFKY